MAQRLRLRLLMLEVWGLIPGWELRFPYVSWPKNQKINKTETIVTNSINGFKKELLFKISLMKKERKNVVGEQRQVNQTYV